MLNDVFLFVLSDRSESRCRADSFRPVGAAYESCLRRLHDIFSTDHRGHGITVCQGFCENSDIGIYVEQEVNTTGCHSKARSNFIEDQYGPNPGCHIADRFEKAWSWFFSSPRLHHDASYFISVGIQDRFELIQPVVLKW